MTAHQHDQLAFEILREDVNAAGIGLAKPILSSEPKCPTTSAHRDLILISGPDRNLLAAQLNSFIGKSDVSAFYFESVSDESVPDLRRWAITHTKISLRVVLSRSQSRANNEDYGIIYVGNNPEFPAYYLIWLAGLHSRGTIGAIRAFLEPKVQTYILEEFSRGKTYVSAIVRFDCSNEAAGGTADLLYA